MSKKKNEQIPIVSNIEPNKKALEALAKLAAINLPVPGYSNLYPKNFVSTIEAFNLSNRVIEALKTKNAMDSFNKSFYNFTTESVHHTVKKQNIDSEIQNLQEYFKNDKLVLVLGAGVSMPFGLPSWQLLLQKLMVTTIETGETASTIAELFYTIFNPNPLIAGRYLQKQLDDKKESFDAAVRKILYENVDNNVESLLMKEIVKFCIAAGKSPNLNSIITYNFDDLLEQSISKLDMELPYCSIYGNGQEIKPSELPIYHVHGFLPQSGEISELNNITFGENFYHQQYSDIYSWNNLVQINKFRECNCLFLGFSLTDPNTRRLLDVANQQRITKSGFHYIFKQRPDKKDVKIILDEWLSKKEEKGEVVDKIDEFVETLINMRIIFEEQDMLSLGVKVIWVNNYEEIPIILQRIRTFDKKVTF